jgi:hypothetical protein
MKTCNLLNIGFPIHIFNKNNWFLIRLKGYIQQRKNIDKIKFPLKRYIKQDKEVGKSEGKGKRQKER